MKKSFIAGLGAVMASVGLIACSTPSLAWGGFGFRHPRRAEVLGRDRGLNGELNRDYGHLGGHFGQLKSEDRAIRAQEQADARFNGGYITRGEKAQLNREENHVQRQINRDLR